MGKASVKAMKARGGRGNKVAVKRMVSRGGRSFQQTFWVRPKQAKAMQEKKKAEIEKFQKEGASLMEQLKKKVAPLPELPKLKKGDQVAADELSMFIDNDYKLHTETLQHIEHKLAQDWKNGRYNHENAIKAFQRLANKGAAAYVLEFGASSSAAFTGDVRKYIAHEYARGFLDAARHGEHGPGSELKPGEKPKGKLSWSNRFADPKSQQYLKEGFEKLGMSQEAFEETYKTPDGYELKIDDLQQGNMSPGSVWNPWIRMSGQIVDEEGNDVGELRRTLEKDQDTGKLKVKHDVLWLNDDERGSGVGTEMILNQFEQYEKHGNVEEVSLNTDSVGKYLWMKIGFKPDEESTKYLRSHADRFLNEVSHQLDIGQQNLLAVMMLGDLNKFARMKGLPEVEFYDFDGVKQTAPFNKAMFLHEDTPGWSGSIPVGGPGWDEAKEVLNGYSKR